MSVNVPPLCGGVLLHLNTYWFGVRECVWVHKCLPRSRHTVAVRKEPCCRIVRHFAGRRLGGSRSAATCIHVCELGATLTGAAKEEAAQSSVMVWESNACGG